MTFAGVVSTARRGRRRAAGLELIIRSAPRPTIKTYHGTKPKRSGLVVGWQLESAERPQGIGVALVAVYGC